MAGEDAVARRVAGFGVGPDEQVAASPLSTAAISVSSPSWRSTMYSAAPDFEVKASAGASPGAEMSVRSSTASGALQSREVCVGARSAGNHSICA